MRKLHVLSCFMAMLIATTLTASTHAESSEEYYVQPFLSIAQSVYADDFIETTAVQLTGYVCVKFDTTSISAKYTEKTFYKGIVDYCRELCSSDAYSALEYELAYFEGHTSMRDSSGNVYVDKVMSIDMSKKAVEQAAQDGVYAKDIPNIGENLWKSPALQ